MLPARAIFAETSGSHEASRVFYSIAVGGKAQGGWVISAHPAHLAIVSEADHIAAQVFRTPPARLAWGGWGPPVVRDALRTMASAP